MCRCFSAPHLSGFFSWQRTHSFICGCIFPNSLCAITKATRHGARTPRHPVKIPRHAVENARQGNMQTERTMGAKSPDFASRRKHSFKSYHYSLKRARESSPPSFAPIVRLHRSIPMHAVKIFRPPNALGSQKVFCRRSHSSQLNILIQHPRLARTHARALHRSLYNLLSAFISRSLHYIYTTEYQHINASAQADSNFPARVFYSSKQRKIGHGRG